MFRRESRRERGAVAVEMALVLPVLLLMVGGIIDLGRAFMTQSILTNAAREGTRYAITQTTGTAATVNANIISRTQAAANGTFSPVASVSPYKGCIDAVTGTNVDVTVTATFDWFFLDALPGTLPPSMTANSVVGCK